MFEIPIPADQSVEQKLAAILAADAVGYSALMGDDERATVATLDACRRVFRTHVVAQNGRVVDTAGDSVLAVFPSTIGAVRAAIAIQDELKSRNENLSEERRMRFRIGVNLGDVIEKNDGTVYGDGVNIAARLESLAEPGGLNISGTTFDHVDGKLDIGFEYLGEKNVKNIARPVRVYRANLGASETQPILPLTAPAAERPSIAVLPFENMSGSAEQEYFADGIADDIITELSKISGLFVIARNSSFVFKGRAVNVPSVAAELGVRYILEGGVRRAGDRVRISAQLIDGATGGHVWAERYDRDLSDIFAIQDDVTRKIVDALSVHLTRGEKVALAGRTPIDVRSYDYLLRAREQAWRHTKDGNEEARRLLNQVIRQEPEFSEPYALLAFVTCIEYVNGWATEEDNSLAEAQSLAQRAVAADQNQPYAELVYGITQLWSKQVDEAIAHAHRAIDIEPNFAEGYNLLAHASYYAGAFDDGLAALDRVVEIDPLFPSVVLHHFGQCYFGLRRYDEAVKVLKERIKRTPDSDTSRFFLAACYGHMGKAQDAEAIWRELMSLNPQFSVVRRRKILPYKRPSDFQSLVDGLQMAGLEIRDEPEAN